MLRTITFWGGILNKDELRYKEILSYHLMVSVMVMENSIQLLLSLLELPISQFPLQGNVMHVCLVLSPMTMCDRHKK